MIIGLTVIMQPQMNLQFFTLTIKHVPPTCDIQKESVLSSLYVDAYVCLQMKRKELMRRDDEDGDSMLSSTLSDGGSVKRKRYIYSISEPLVVYVWHLWHYIVEYIVYRACFARVAVANASLTHHLLQP